MRDTAEFDWGRLEDHCYFPEWADRPPAGGSLHEVDHNSYLAGGYAEEFGHRARPLTAQSMSIPAEADGDWRVQIGGLHPGYPECPRPLDRELLMEGRGASDRPRTQPAGGRSQREPAGFRVVRVGQEGAGKPRHRLWATWRKFRIRRNRLPLG